MSAAHRNDYANMVQIADGVVVGEEALLPLDGNWEGGYRALKRWNINGRGYALVQSITNEIELVGDDGRSGIRDIREMEAVVGLVKKTLDELGIVQPSAFEVDIRTLAVSLIVKQLSKAISEEDYAKIEEETIASFIAFACRFYPSENVALILERVGTLMHELRIPIKQNLYMNTASEFLKNGSALLSALGVKVAIESGKEFALKACEESFRGFDAELAGEAYDRLCEAKKQCEAMEKVKGRVSDLEESLEEAEEAYECGDEACPMCSSEEAPKVSVSNPDPNEPLVSMDPVGVVTDVDPAGYAVEIGAPDADSVS